MKLPFQIDLTGKVVVVTGAGGVICSVLAEAMAMTGAKVALLDLNEDAAKKHADDITAKGYIAKGYKCNVLEKASVQAARDQIAADFGTCDILINGAGGNNPKATTDDEYFVPEDLGQMKTFFDLDADGVSFVFSLNFTFYKALPFIHSFVLKFRPFCHLLVLLSYRCPTIEKLLHSKTKIYTKSPLTFLGQRAFFFYRGFPVYLSIQKTSFLPRYSVLLKVSCTTHGIQLLILIKSSIPKEGSK